MGLVIAGVVVVASASFAQQWPRFRGPAGSGVAEDQPLLTAWDAASGRGILWKTPVPGLGHSSPVVWGDRRVDHHGAAVPLPTSTTTRKTAVSIRQKISPSTSGASSRLTRTPAGCCRPTLRIAASRKSNVTSKPRRPTPRPPPTDASSSRRSDPKASTPMTSNGTLFWKQDLGILDPGYAGQPELAVGVCHLADHPRRPRHPAVRHPAEVVHHRVQCQGWHRAPGAPTATRFRHGARR